VIVGHGECVRILRVWYFKSGEVVGGVAEAVRKAAILSIIFTMQKWCVIAAGGADALLRSSSSKHVITKALQWKGRTMDLPAGLVVSGAQKKPIRVTTGFKVHASAWNSGSARNEEAKHEKVAEECLNGDATDGSLSGLSFQEMNIQYIKNRLL
jgi:hypothetical protein